MRIGCSSDISSSSDTPHPLCPTHDGWTTVAPLSHERSKGQTTGEPVALRYERERPRRRQCPTSGLCGQEGGPFPALGARNAADCRRSVNRDPLSVDEK